jgi:membrane protein required for colicin V production
MNVLDGSVLGIALISALLGLWSGGIKMLLSLLSWVAAWWGACQFSDRLAIFLPHVLGNPLARHSLGWIGVFVLVLLGFSLLGMVLTASVNAVGLSGFNRVLGLLFGLMRGLLFLVLLADLAGWTDLPRTQWWRSSQSGAYLLHMANATQSWLPAGWVTHYKHFD